MEYNVLAVPAFESCSMAAITTFVSAVPVEWWLVIVVVLARQNVNHEGPTRMTHETYSEERLRRSTP